MKIRTILVVFGAVLLAACAEAPKKQELGTTFYPMPPETPRLQFLTTITKEQDLKGGASDFKKYLLGTDAERGGKQLARPFALAHRKGRLYLADKTAHQIMIVDLEKKSLDYIRDLKGGPLQDPTDVYITPDGYKYVADEKRGEIVVFNERDEFFRTYGSEQEFRPVAVAVRGNRIYVADIRDNEVEVLDKDSGEVVGKIGEVGTAQGRFHKPVRLALDSSGNLFVTDFLNFRVQMFDQAGKYIRQIGELGSYPGTFARPKGIDLDLDGHLYAVDAAFENVQIFDVKSGEPLLAFGKYGPRPGGTYLPAAVHIDYDNVQYFQQYVDPNFKVKYLVYVTNTLGDKKLNVYGFGDWIGPELHYVPKQKPAAGGPGQQPASLGEVVPIQ